MIPVPTLPSTMTDINERYHISVVCPVPEFETLDEWRAYMKARKAFTLGWFNSEGYLYPRHRDNMAILRKLGARVEIPPPEVVSTDIAKLDDGVTSLSNWNEQAKRKHCKNPVAEPEKRELPLTNRYGVLDTVATSEEGESSSSLAETSSCAGNTAGCASASTQEDADNPVDRDKRLTYSEVLKKEPDPCLTVAHQSQDDDSWTTVKPKKQQPRGRQKNSNAVFDTGGKKKKNRRTKPIPFDQPHDALSDAWI